ncbi:hypothetical protein GOV04_00375 [Candidatus Woesearchaeota archaeon]|nr:hypothetical protein [Candidatus Woesearchaeota archaeon]
MQEDDSLVRVLQAITHTSRRVLRPDSKHCYIIDLGRIATGLEPDRASEWEGQKIAIPIKRSASGSFNPQTNGADLESHVFLKELNIYVPEVIAKQARLDYSPSKVNDWQVHPCDFGARLLFWIRRESKYRTKP